MSDPAVSTFLTKVLCSRGGRLPRSLLPIFLKLSTEQIEEILQDEPEKFPQAGEMVLAQSPVRTCDKYLENIQEEECDKLHLCRNYLRGKCWPNIRPRCPFSHDILSDQNQKVLKANEISGLNEDEIKVLLLQNDNQLLPGVCEKYLGESCDLGEDCSRLHICGSFICGQCGGGDCRRSHDLLEFSSDLLLSRCNFPELSIKNFQALCAVKHNGRLQSLMVKEKPENEEETPTALSGPRKRKNSVNVSQNEGHGRLQDTAESNSQRGSDSRPTSENGVINLCLQSTEDDDEKPAKLFIVEDLESPDTPHPLPVSSSSVIACHSSSIQSAVTSPKVSSAPHKSSSQSGSDSCPMLDLFLLSTEADDEKPAKLFIVQDFESSDTPHPLPVSSSSVMACHSSSIQSAVTSPKVSSAPHNEFTPIPNMLLDDKSIIFSRGFPDGLLPSSQGPSAFQPKATSSPVTTDRPANPSPVSMDALSISKEQPVASFDNSAASDFVVNSTVPPTLNTSPIGLVDPITKGPSVSQENLESSDTPHPLPVSSSSVMVCHSSSIQSAVTSPKVSSAPHNEFTPIPSMLLDFKSILFSRIAAGLSSSSQGPSAPVPKPTSSPVTTDRPANPSPVPLDLPSVSKEQSVASFDNPAPSFLVMDSSTVPPTLYTSPIGLVDPITKGPSASQENPVTLPFVSSPRMTPFSAPPTPDPRLVNSLICSWGPSVPLENPVNTPFAIPYSAQPVVTPITLLSSPIASSASATLTSVPILVNSLICPIGPSVSQANPVTTHITSPYHTQPNVPTIKLVSFPAVSPSSASPALDLSLVNSSKSHSFFQGKPVTTMVTNPYSNKPVITAIKPVPPTVESPTCAPSTLQLVPHQPLHQLTSLVNFPTKDPFVPQENPVQSSVQSQPPGEPVDTNRDPNKDPEICLSNLWKHCKLEGRCPDMHYYLPYRWQINKGTDWGDIPNMEEIEICYSIPAVDRIQSIDFLTMRSGEHPVRRLSTVSSVMKPPEYVLTTEWLWYWKDEYGAWTQYGHSNVIQVRATATSSDLENVYLADPNTVLPFVAGIHQYEIHFQEMKQKNILYKTEKDVRRRPKYLSFEDVKFLKGRTKSSVPQTSLKINIYPSTWDTSALPEIGCQKVLIPDTSSEFTEIVLSFTKTVSGHMVKNLWRIQNPFLWQLFQWQKEHMKQVNQGQDVKELQLFHGTGITHIEAICNQNFDWRVCGTHGTVYGQGSYFARDASYSHNYSAPMYGRIRMMFVARVLVGDYVLGNPHMKRPPQRPGSTTRYYDSCVDNMYNPSIFVVFEKHQIYPEYLLQYEQQTKS